MKFYFIYPISDLMKLSRRFSLYFICTSGQTERHQETLCVFLNMRTQEHVNCFCTSAITCSYHCRKCTSTEFAIHIHKPVALLSLMQERVLISTRTTSLKWLNTLTGTTKFGSSSVSTVCNTFEIRADSTNVEGL